MWLGVNQDIGFGGKGGGLGGGGLVEELAFKYSRRVIYGLALRFKMLGLGVDVYDSGFGFRFRVSR